MTDPLLLPKLSRRRGAAARSTTWWGKAFVRSFEENVLDARDLVTARSLARSGRLGAIVVLPGMASAILDDTLTPQLRVERLTDTAWADFADELLREAGHLASVEAGRLPADLIEACDELGIELAPGAPDIETACPCEAWAQPCIHALALLYQLAWHLDRDPYVLLLLRGRTREQLIAATESPVGGALPVVDPSRDPDPLREAATRAAELLALAQEAPTGHGLADSEVAAYDEAASHLLGD